MKFGSLFSGVGGFDLGFERAGMACAWQCEIDAAASSVLAHHWPNVKRYTDVRHITSENAESVDLICGGFPCQDVSIAGERLGLGGKRSTLWSEFARIIRQLRPGWVVAENVGGLLSSDDGRFFGNILRDLADLGYDAEWTTISPSYFGAPQSRYRVFIVANSQNQRFRWGEWSQRETDPAIWGEIRATGFAWPQFTDRILRAGNGLPAPVDRRKQLGNSIVPQIAEWIGRALPKRRTLSPSDEQRRMINALDECTFQPGSSPKRFVRQMRDVVILSPDSELTPRQDWYLRRLYYSYRRQIGHANPKPDDFDSPPPGTKRETHPPRTLQDYSFDVERDRNSAAAAELQRLAAWNAGQPRKA